MSQNIKYKVGECPICERDLIKGPSINQHHLIPKSEKGKDCITLHVVCHSKIHSLFNENELRDYYHTIERLKSHEQIKKFIKWVQKKDPEFLTSSKQSKRRTKKR